MDKHSPTPWAVRPHLPDAHFEVVADAEGNTVGTATRPDDAALIVAAVNERARLRDIVRELADEVNQLEEVDLVCNTDRAMRIEAPFREAREALGEDAQREANLRADRLVAFVRELADCLEEAGGDAFRALIDRAREATK
jgi:hypothetical protein